MNDAFSTYQAAQKDMWKLFKEGMSPQEIDVMVAKQKEILQKARAQITLPEFQALIDTGIAELQESLKYEKEEAQHRQDLFHAPAANWKTTDLQGNPHALADYKGKIVVLDFWYRGCGWCMLAMPLVKAAAEHFAGKPVVFLAMTTDDPKSKDADFVVKNMGLTYPTLYAGDIAKDYKISGFPTLLILDQNGVVKDIDEGYSSNLRDKIEQKVDELLKAAPVTAAPAG
jgi:thiol-disulfide isomerase/thioredoxin